MYRSKIPAEIREEYDGKLSKSTRQEVYNITININPFSDRVDQYVSLRYKSPARELKPQTELVISSRVASRTSDQQSLDRG